MAEFSENVWRLTKQIPKGKVATYGQLARALGMPGAGRAVGQALKMNPHAPIVPCHRVVKSDGRLGGYAGRRPARIKEKIRLLKSEGIEISGGKVMNMKERIFRFV